MKYWCNFGKKYSLQFNLFVPLAVDIKIKKIRGPPKIVDACTTLGIFNIKKR